MNTTRSSIDLAMQWPSLRSKASANQTSVLDVFADPRLVAVPAGPMSLGPFQRVGV